jgi:hypothetical protein
MTRKATSRGRAETPTGNLYEATARARKAFRICAVMVEGIDATPGFPLTARNIHRIITINCAATFRQDFERLAGVRPASQVTWATVEGLLLEHYFPPPMTSEYRNVVHD